MAKNTRKLEVVGDLWVSWEVEVVDRRSIPLWGNGKRGTAGPYVLKQSGGRSVG